MLVIHIFVKSYFNEELTTYLGAYTFDFVIIPRVGDFITTNYREKSLSCCVKEVKFIPTFKNSVDYNVVLQCLEIEITLLTKLNQLSEDNIKIDSVLTANITV